MIQFYDSLHDLRAYALSQGITSHGPSSSAYGVGPSSEWYNNESLSDTLHKLDVGDLSLVPHAQSLIDSLEQGLDVPRKAWERAPAGAYACVPDYCMGLPTSMRRRIDSPSESSPITILVCTTSSAGISADTLSKRGCAILALTMALSASRAVSLRVVSLGDGRDGETILVTTLNTTPLDLASACYVLTSAGFDRRIHHYVEHRLNNSKVHWPNGYISAKKAWLDALPARLGFDPANTLLVAPAYLTDSLLLNPVAWINDQISRFRLTNAE